MELRVVEFRKCINRVKVYYLPKIQRPGTSVAMSFVGARVTHLSITYWYLLCPATALEAKTSSNEQLEIMEIQSESVIAGKKNTSFLYLVSLQFIP